MTGVTHRGPEYERPGMFPERNVGGRDRLARGVLAVLLTVVAAWALRRGKRPTGVAAAIGAAGLGFNVVSCFCGLNAALGRDTTRD